VAIVARLDARLNVQGLLGLHEGDAHVIRNAGRFVTQEELRSLAISQRLLGTTEIVLVHHTDCDMHTFTAAEFRFQQQIEADTGVRPRRSATSTRTYARTSPGSGPSRRSRTRTRCVGPSTT